MGGGLLGGQVFSLLGMGRGGSGVRVGGAALPAPRAPRSGAWLQPGLTFQVSLAGDQSTEATNTAQNSEAPRPPPRVPPPLPPLQPLRSSPQPCFPTPPTPGAYPLGFPTPPSVPPTPSEAAFGGRAPSRPSLTLPGRPHPSPPGAGISRHN